MIQRLLSPPERIFQRSSCHPTWSMSPSLSRRSERSHDTAPTIKRRVILSSSAYRSKRSWTRSVTQEKHSFMKTCHFDPSTSSATSPLRDGHPDDFFFFLMIFSTPRLCHIRPLPSKASYKVYGWKLVDVELVISIFLMKYLVIKRTILREMSLLKLWFY